jgi:hypothetical protein
MKKGMTTEEYITRLTEVRHSAEPTEIVQMKSAELTIWMFAGRESVCPDEDRSCDECDCHDIRMVDDITVRVCSLDGCVCCVEEPAVDLNPDWVINYSNFMRFQLRLTSGKIRVGLVVYLGNNLDDLLGLYSK